MASFKSVVVASAVSLTMGMEICENGFGCPVGNCTVTSANAGARFGCTPAKLGPHAAMCKDKRFSCAVGETCDLSAGKCVGPKNAYRRTINLNENAVRVNSTKIAAGDASLCSDIQDDLPSFCNCDASASGTYGAQVTCSVDILDVETIDVVADLEPCKNPMYISLKVTEEDLGFSWSDSISAGDTEEIDIGLDIGIPDIGDAGVYMAVGINGDLSDVQVQLGVDVCATLPIIGKECGSSITSGLPIWILDETFSFSDVCN